ncbi:MAG: hypothetical protein GF384_01735 [Elusimicrobia bacterium]|nr:hypothetical protein [Elusimicrobiota bacterium]MBD3411718.1 hypothetical protein [Elusimicrobiota bacterium]
MSIWGLELVCFYLMNRSFSLNMSFVNVLFVAICIVLGILIPAAPGYVGTYEFAGRAALEFVGVDPNVGLSFILFLHFFQFIFILLFGFPSMIKQNISFKEIKNDAR